jgi:hypothetical protein
MNIFVSDNDPIICAKFLDDCRCVKMVLETAQMLSTAISYCGGLGPYKITHINHPCSVWTRQSKANYRWLYSHFEALCSEYTKRYHKTHKCSVLKDMLAVGVELIPDGQLTTFPNCTIFKEENDIHKAYTKYLQFKWQNDKRKPTRYKQLIEV